MPKELFPILHGLTSNSTPGAKQGINLLIYFLQGLAHN
jgi:hypothetical protein